MNLSDKRELKKYGMSHVYPEKDVKEKVQEALEKVRVEIFFTIPPTIDRRKVFRKIDKVFLEVFGPKLIGVKE